MLDIRLPIGYLFLIIGSILTIYSIVQPQISRLEVVGSGAPHVLLLNIDLPCGISMLVFAAIMLGMSYSDRSNAKATLPLAVDAQKVIEDDK
jgi:hypothetical protein